MFIDGDSAAIEEQTKLFGGKKWTEVKESTHLAIQLENTELPGYSLIFIKKWKPCNKE